MSKKQQRQAGDSPTAAPEAPATEAPVVDVAGGPSGSEQPSEAVATPSEADPELERTPEASASSEPSPAAAPEAPAAADPEPDPALPKGPRPLPPGHKRPTLEEFVACGYQAENYEAHMARWEAELMGIDPATVRKPPTKPRSAGGKVLCKVVGPGSFFCEGRMWTEGTEREFNATDADSPVLERVKT